MEEVDGVMQVVVKNMKDLRLRHGLTAQRLAEQMTAIGIPWEAGVVTKLETGRRKSVSVDELLALACVFDVTPLALLLPASNTAYRVAPKIIEQADDVAKWIVGTKLLPRSPHVGEVMPDHPGNHAVRMERYLAERPHYLVRPITEYAFEERVQQVQAQYQEDLQRGLKTLEERIRELEASAQSQGGTENT